MCCRCLVISHSSSVPFFAYWNSDAPSSVSFLQILIHLSASNSWDLNTSLRDLNISWITFILCYRFTYRNAAILKTPEESLWGQNSKCLICEKFTYAWASCTNSLWSTPSTTGYKLWLPFHFHSEQWLSVSQIYSIWHLANCFSFQ